MKLLEDLINLTKIKIENQYLRALAYQLYENNGVLKRKILKKLLNLFQKKKEKNFGIWVSKLDVTMFFFLKC